MSIQTYVLLVSSLTLVVAMVGAIRTWNRINRTASLVDREIRDLRREIDKLKGGK